MSDPIWRTLDGVIVFGRYHANEGMVYLQTPYGRRATQIGGSSARGLALIMLRELWEGMHG
jgi:hypothetical protein